MESVNAVLSKLTGLSVASLVRLLCTVVAGIVVIKLLMRAVRRASARIGSLNPAVSSLICKLIHGVLYFLLILVCTQGLGLEVTSLVALFSVFGLAVSLALQDSLANVAGGIFLLLAKPFAPGDFIEVGDTSGTAVSIGFVHTVINTVDNRRVFLPNGFVSKSRIINVTAEPTRKLEFTVPISYRCDLAAAHALIDRVARADERVLRDPEPFVKVWNFAPTAVEVLVRVAVRRADLADVRSDLLLAVKQALDEAGMSIPFARPDVPLIRN